MRILMYSYYFPPEYSGAAKQAIALSKLLRQMGHHVEFLTTHCHGSIPQGTFDGFSVCRVKTGPPNKHNEIMLWMNILSECFRLRSKFDIFHSHGANYLNSIVGPIARLMGWKSLVKGSLARSDLNDINITLSGRIHRIFLNHVDACVAISRELEAEFLRAGIQKHKVHYIPNGVDINRFYPATPSEKKRIRNQLGLPPSRLIALAVGVLDDRKRLAWLAREWVRSHGFGTSAMLLIIGPQSRDDPHGNIKDSVVRLAADHPEILRFGGYTEIVEVYYRAADVFVLPSSNEGMPNVILEAMASALPCIATKTSGTIELIEDGVNGRTFEGGNLSQLGSAIEEVLSRSSDMALSSRRITEAKYSLSLIAREYEGLYRTLLVNQD